MEENRLFNLLEVEQIFHRIKELNLNSTWNFIVQSMTSNYLYAVEKAIEDAKSPKSEQNSTEVIEEKENKVSHLIENTKQVGAK